MSASKMNLVFFKDLPPGPARPCPYPPAARIYNSPGAAGCSGTPCPCRENHSPTTRTGCTSGCFCRQVLVLVNRLKRAQGVRCVSGRIHRVEHTSS